LERDGQFTVDTCTSASSGLTFLKSANYDAIVSDYQMPGMNGIDLLRQIRSTGNSIPFILFTGRGREEVVIQALNEGADYYLQKGGDPLSQFAELTHKIHQAVTRKHAEEVLRESEARFRTLLQHIPSVSVQGYRMDGTTHYWNDASEHIYGYTAKEAIGKNLVELLIPPEMQNDVRKAIAYMAKTGQPIPASELSLMRKDGSRVEVFSSHAIIKSSQGEKELFCIDIDLTERKRIEEALRQANEKLDLLSGRAPEHDQQPADRDAALPRHAGE